VVEEQRDYLWPLDLRMKRGLARATTRLVGVGAVLEHEPGYLDVDMCEECVEFAGARSKIGASCGEEVDYLPS